MRRRRQTIRLSSRFNVAVKHCGFGTLQKPFEELKWFQSKPSQNFLHLQLKYCDRPSIGLVFRAADGDACFGSVDVKDVTTSQHHVHGPSEFGSQDVIGSGCRLFLLYSFGPSLGFWAETFKKRNSFAESPLQKCITDFLSG